MLNETIRNYQLYIFTVSWINWGYGTTCCFCVLLAIDWTDDRKLLVALWQSNCGADGARSRLFKSPPMCPNDIQVGIVPSVIALKNTFTVSHRVFARGG